MGSRGYFTYKGIMYPRGTIFTIMNMNNEIEASFLRAIDGGRESMYCYKCQGKELWSYEHLFYSYIYRVTDKVDPEVKPPKVIVRKDSQIDGLVLGWMWYIFLMVISTIFKDNIGLWIFESIVFWSWRAKKIKEEGTYIEW